MQEVLKGSIELFPHWCVNRSPLGGSGGSDSSAVGALLSQEMYRRGTLKLEEHVMFESAVASSQSRPLGLL